MGIWVWMYSFRFSRFSNRKDATINTLWLEPAELFVNEEREDRHDLAESQHGHKQGKHQNKKIAAIGRFHFSPNRVIRFTTVSLFPRFHPL